MYLTRQPIGRCKLPDPVNITVYKVSRPIRPRCRAAYLCFKFRIATTSKAKVSIICISSYVLISISPFHKTGSGTSTPLGCLGKYIIQCVVKPLALTMGSVKGYCSQRFGGSWLLWYIWYNVLNKTTGKDGCTPSAPGKYLSYYEIVVLTITSEQDGYFLCVKVRIAISKLQAVKRIMNSS